MKQIYVYLDWNVFNKIEHLKELPENEQHLYAAIEKLITEKRIIVPYSNAHINDLIRGYDKNPAYIDGHLQGLKNLTENLCITQYWGQKSVTWHIREVKEFFESALADSSPSSSYSDLLESDETGLLKIALMPFKTFQLHENFREIFKADPIFERMFPRAKVENTLYSMIEDLYAFSINAKKDFSLYKSLKAFITKSRAQFSDPKVLAQIDKSLAGTPSHLVMGKLLQRFAPKNKTSENPACQRVTDEYYKLDLEGYKSDEKFANMIDDSLHVFYGAHCEYFVTCDDKCQYKASQVYAALGIKSRAFKPDEFLHEFKILYRE